MGKKLGWQDLWRERRRADVGKGRSGESSVMLRMLLLSELASLESLVGRYWAVRLWRWWECIENEMYVSCGVSRI